MCGANYARNGRAVHMDIKHVQENTDPLKALSSLLEFRYIRDFAISGRHHSAWFGGNNSMWVTKEPQEEPGEKYRNNGPNRTCQPRHQRSRAEKHQSIVVAVSNHMG